MLLKIEIDRVKWNGSEKKPKQNYKYFFISAEQLKEFLNF